VLRKRKGRVESLILSGDYDISLYFRDVESLFRRCTETVDSGADCCHSLARYTRGTTNGAAVSTTYRASKSRNQGRESWSVIFRHPARLDGAMGKTGRRIRRGLGTADEAEASRLVDELNEILASPELWAPASRELAAARYNARVVEMFYEGAEASRLDFQAIRDETLPLPTAAEHYHRVLLLGTTGAGKTTVVRQLLGTDPVTERFPSTSTAKTTVADTELIATDASRYAAVVTFVPREEVIDYLTENVVAAALAAFNGRSDGEVVRRLLDHVDQRFRLSYVLGRGRPAGHDDDVEDDDVVGEDIDNLLTDAGAADAELVAVGAEDLDLGATQTIIADAVSALRQVVDGQAAALRDALGPDDDDERVAQELIEEELESELRESEEFYKIVDALADEIEKRFVTLKVGDLRRNRQGWPISWTWEAEDRTGFIKTISRFSSNYAPLFGHLLTPLVNGIRVAGPFTPKWGTDSPKLVLIDGEGLGHTPTSASTLSTPVAKRLEGVEAILLVDNATQPMQAAPTAAMKAIAVSGNATKLNFVFTHFDQVAGDNLPTFSAREEHVLASVENVLNAIGEDLGPAAERVLRQRLDEARFFVGGIHEELDAKKKSASRTIGQLESLLEALVTDPQRVDTGPSSPIYDRMNVSLAVAEAATAFHDKWLGLLGLESNPSVPKEHWARVKALSRRLAEGWADEYDTLKPVADLRYELQRQVFLMLQRPLRWDGGEPDDDVKQVIIDEISVAITRGLFGLTRERIADDTRLAWQEAYAQRGTGSTFVRARIIASEVYDRGAPIPGVVASPDQNSFLRAVANLISEVAEQSDMTLE
jgi:hypothetical protein